jgi:hypothetical protein
VGSFHNDRRHGYGVYTTPGGTELAGNWENNKYVGGSHSVKGLMTAIKRSIYADGGLTTFGIVLLAILLLSVAWFGFSRFYPRKEVK